MGSAEVVMDNDETLPIARGMAAEAKKKLLEYVRRNGR
jgi:hypothetical protein